MLQGSLSKAVLQVCARIGIQLGGRLVLQVGEVAAAVEAATEVGAVEAAIEAGAVLRQGTEVKPDT